MLRAGRSSPRFLLYVIVFGSAIQLGKRRREADGQEVHTAFRIGGLDPEKNPRLAKALALAKDAGVPKANIEGAFARVSVLRRPRVRSLAQDRPPRAADFWELCGAC